MNYDMLLPYVETFTQTFASIFFSVKILSQVGSLWMVISIICKIHDSYLLSRMNNSVYDIADYTEKISEKS